MSLVGIGDSVFEDALSEIKALLPGGYYDAKISRPLVTGNEILRNLPNVNTNKNELYIHIRGGDIFINPIVTNKIMNKIVRKKLPVSGLIK